MPAIPHYPLKRACLEQTSVQGCLDLCTAMVATSAGNMVFGDGAGQVADIEIGVDNQTAIIPGPQEWRGAAAGHDDRRAACCRLHTNHYLDPVLARYGSICGARREYVGTSQARVLLLFCFCFFVLQPKSYVGGGLRATSGAFDGTCGAALGRTHSTTVSVHSIMIAAVFLRNCTRTGIYRTIQNWF